MVATHSPTANIRTDSVISALSALADRLSLGDITAATEQLEAAEAAGLATRFPAAARKLRSQIYEFDLDGAGELAVAL